MIPPINAVVVGVVPVSGQMRQYTLSVVTAGDGAGAGGDGAGGTNPKFNNSRRRCSS